MVKIAGSVPLKTRLPLTAWVLAGTRDTLFNGFVARARCARFRSNSVYVGAGNGARITNSPRPCGTSHASTLGATRYPRERFRRN